MTGVCLFVLFVHSHLSLRSSPPGIREDGADNTLRSGVAWCCHFWYAAVWLAGVIGLGLWIMVTKDKTNKHKEALLSFSIKELLVHSMTKKLCKSKRMDLGGWKNWILTSWRKKRGRTNHMWPPSSSLPPENWCTAASRTEKHERRTSSDKQQQENYTKERNNKLNYHQNAWIRHNTETALSSRNIAIILTGNSGSWHPQHVGTSTMCAATHTLKKC